jgi:hypothetical protein
MFSGFLNNWSEVCWSEELNIVNCFSVSIQNIIDTFDFFTSLV